MKSSVVTIAALIIFNGLLIGVWVYLNFNLFFAPQTPTLNANSIRDLPSTSSSTQNAADSPLTGQITSELPSDAPQPTWNTHSITYSFVNEKACLPHESLRVRKAFEIISDGSDNQIIFTEVNQTGMISIECTSQFNNDTDSAEQGKFASAVTTTQISGSTIRSAEIVFYHITSTSIASNCGSFPDTEVHEILHAFAFPHTTERFHIMNPEQLYCPTKLNSDIELKLKELYP